jgi:hypothetical protein
MIKDHLEYDQQHALEAILRHHLDLPGLDPVRRGQLKHDLATFINWIIAEKDSKLRFGSGGEPPPLIVLLGQMGLYSKHEAEK